MTQSDVEICNLALALVSARPITSLDDDVVEAEKCSIFYEHCRRKVLRDFPWNFAIKRQALSLDSQAPVYGFTYRFTLPTDCLRVLDTDLDNFITQRQLYAGFYNGAFVSEKWKIEGRYLVTNVDQVKIRYIFDNESTGEYDSAFIDAFSLYLASKLVIPLTSDFDLSSKLEERYMAHIQQAWYVDSLESSPESTGENTWDLSRL